MGTSPLLSKACHPGSGDTDPQPQSQPRVYENPGGQTEPGDDPSSDQSEDLARTVSSEVSRTEHVFVTNEDEISPKEAIAKLNKSLEERLDKMMEIIEAMRALICFAQKTR